MNVILEELCVIFFVKLGCLDSENDNNAFDKLVLLFNFLDLI